MSFRYASAVYFLQGTSEQGTPPRPRPQSDKCMPDRSPFKERKLRQLVHDMRSQLFCIEINAKALDIHLPELLKCYQNAKSTGLLVPNIPAEHLELIANSAAEISDCLTAIDEKLEEQLTESKSVDDGAKLELVHVDEISPTMKRPKLKILLAEDEAIHQDISRKILTSCNCSLVIVDDGEDAVRQLELESFDLILMDMHMPELNGMQAVKRMREMNNQRGRTPIIGISNIEPLNTEEFFQAGFNAFLLKPLKLDPFIDVVLQFHPHWKA